MHHPELTFLVYQITKIHSLNKIVSWCKEMWYGCILLLRKILEIEDLLISLFLLNCLVDRCGFTVIAAKTLIALLLFVAEYSFLFWHVKRVMLSKTVFHTLKCPISLVSLDIWLHRAQQHVCSFIGTHLTNISTDR